MGWSETRRRWAILRDIEAAAASGRTDLPWSEEHAALFGTREGLLAMIRYRLRLAYDAQIDTHQADVAIDEHRRRLDARLAGVRRLLAVQDGREVHGGDHAAA